MILYGDKREEYRQAKSYWIKRIDPDLSGKSYTHIRFANGYGAKRPTFVIKLIKISFGFGKIKWGFDDYGSKVYILKLGNIIAKN